MFLDSLSIFFVVFPTGTIGETVIRAFSGHSHFEYDPLLKLLQIVGFGKVYTGLD